MRTFSKAVISGKIWGTWKVLAKPARLRRSGAPVGGFLTKEDHAAGGRLLPAADYIEKCGFASAIGTDEAQDLAFRQGKGDVPQNGLVPKRFFDLLNC